MAEEIISKPTQSHHFALPMRTELRVIANSGCSIMLTAGTAEVFGAELPLNRKMNFGPLTRISVLTFQGAELDLDKLDQENDDAYVSKDMKIIKSYMSLHRVLENERESAEANSGLFGPRIVIIGRPGCGKSSLWKTLSNWDCRFGRNPIAVDLDVAKNKLGLPGSISAANVYFVNLDHLEKAEDNGEHSLSLHFGHTHPNRNPELYKDGVSQLANLVTERLRTDSESRIAGVLVDTCGWIEEQGYHSKVHICRAFNANHVVVMGNDRLLDRLKCDLDKNVNIVNIDVSCGVGFWNEKYAAEMINQNIKRYFYGTAKYPLFPRLLTFKVVPGGEEIKEEEMGIKVKLYSVNMQQIKGGEGDTKQICNAVQVYTDKLSHLKNRLIAISSSRNPQKNLMQSIVGYVLVEDSRDENRINVLAPGSAPVPNNMFLVGDVRYFNDVD